METIDMVVKREGQPNSHPVADDIRDQILDHSKNFKTSWVKLGQLLYAVWNDKYYHRWGFEKFEHYAQKEVGIKKDLCMKLLKTYLFLEENEPAYLKEEFSEERDPVKVPGYEEVNVLRMARAKKELNRDDYREIKSAIFERGKNATEARKELTAMMKERKVVDPEEEREQRKKQALMRMINSLQSFQKDMEVLKLIPEEIVAESKELMTKLESEVE